MVCNCRTSHCLVNRYGDLSLPQNLGYQPLGPEGASPVNMAGSDAAAAAAAAAATPIVGALAVPVGADAEAGSCCEVCPRAGNKTLDQYQHRQA